MNAVSCDTTPIRKAEIITRSVRDELFLYNEKKNVVHTLNATAASIWNCCDGRHTPSDILSQLREQYDAEEEKTSRDVARTLEEFARLELIEVKTL